MEKLSFASAKQLQQFYLDQGFFAIYDCSEEHGELVIKHFALLRTGESISLECEAYQILSLDDERALTILESFLKIGNIIIHPQVFTI